MKRLTLMIAALALAASAAQAEIKQLEMTIFGMD